ncbi:MAG TPA: hypothetical protein VIK55_19940 [Paludibacter sp.]
MSSYSINDISKSADRHKLYILSCNPDELSERILFIQTNNISAVNIGKELSMFIGELGDYSYLNMDVFDFTMKLLEERKAKINDIGNDVVAIYNLGILLEPAIELKAAQLIKEFSKSTVLIIIWENQTDYPDVLSWPTQKNNYSLDFTDTQIKKLQYAI